MDRIPGFVRRRPRHGNAATFDLRADGAQIAGCSGRKLDFGVDAKPRRLHLSSSCQQCVPQQTHQRTYRGPRIDLRIVLSAGATNLNFGPTVESVYNHALTKTYYVPTAMAALCTFGSLAMEWRSVKAKKEKPDEKVEMGTGVEVSIRKEGEKEKREG